MKVKDKNQFKSSSFNSIWDQNHLKFKKIFLSHSSCDKISYQEFIKFCRSSTIIPNLVTIMEVKNIHSKYSISKIKSEITPILSFTQFEELLKEIAIYSVKTKETYEEKFCVFIDHIKNSIKVNYHQTLSSTISEIKPNSTKSKLLSPKNESSNNTINNYALVGCVNSKTEDVVDNNIDLALKVLNMPKKEVDIENISNENHDKVFTEPKNNMSLYRHSYSTERAYSFKFFNDKDGDNFLNMKNRYVKNKNEYLEIGRAHV